MLIVKNFKKILNLEVSMYCLSLFLNILLIIYLLQNIENLLILNNLEKYEASINTI